MSITALHDGDLSRAAAPTPAARRQRRHRARRKQGRFVVRVEVTCEMITALVDQGDVDEALFAAHQWPGSQDLALRSRVR